MWKSTSELGCRADGVGRPKFDFHTGDDPEDRQARKYVGSALKPAKKAALERLVEQLQRDNDRLQASLQLAYERAEAAKGEWEEERESLVQKAKEAATEAKLAIASAQSPQKREPGELAKSAMDPRASRLAAELQLAKERDALRDEVNSLNALRAKDQQTIKESRPVWKSTSASGAPDNSSLSHFSAMTLPRRLRRAVRHQHRHAIEQASRRWRGGRRRDSGRTRRKFYFHTG